jgi:hypothetical protein
MTLVRDRENKKVISSHKSRGFHLPFISKSYAINTDKSTNSYSGNLNFTGSTGTLRYLLKHNDEPKEPQITTRGRSNDAKKKRIFFKDGMDFDHEVPGNPENKHCDGAFPSVGDYICNMDYHKVSVNPPGYRSKPFIFR